MPLSPGKVLLLKLFSNITLFAMRCSARKGRKRESYRIQNFKHAKLLDKLLRKKRFNFKEGCLVTKCYTLVFLYIFFYP